MLEGAYRCQETGTGPGTRNCLLDIATFGSKSAAPVGVVLATIEADDK